MQFWDIVQWEGGLWKDVTESEKETHLTIKVYNYLVESQMSDPA